MAELSKYEILLNELGSLESQVSIVSDKYHDTINRNKELEEELVNLKREHQILAQRIVKLEGELSKYQDKNGDDLFDSLNSNEKESLKGKIEGLISRIDSHLSS